MKEKQTGIAHRAVDLDTEATRLFANAGNCITQFCCNCSLLSLTGMEAGKYREFNLGALDFCKVSRLRFALAVLCEIRNSDYEQHRAHEHTPEM
jgi:hypothetical protein